MSITFSIAELLLLEIAPLIENQTFRSISEGPINTFYLTVGRNHLLICLKHPLIRFHLVEKIPKGKRVPFLEKCHGGTVEKLQLLNDDRILEMVIKSNGKKFHLIAELFPKKPNLYLLDEKRTILTSWKRVENQTYKLPEKPCPTKSSPQPHSITSAAIASEYAERELNQRKGAVELYITKKLRNLNKKKRSLEQDLERSLMWKEFEHVGKLLQANFYRIEKGMRSIDVEDWEKEGALVTLLLDPKRPPQEVVAGWFKKSKKARAAIDHLRDQIEKLAHEEHLFKQQLENWEQFEFPEEVSTQPRVPQPKLPYRQYKTKSGMVIWVGKSANDNEVLTFTCAKGSDWWFHTHDVPGSHVILRVEKGREPDEASIAQAMQLALKFSRAKDERHAEILVTQVKYVSRIKQGKKGQVMISKKQIRHISSAKG